MEEEEKSRKPKDDNFRQQRLKGWRVAPGPIPLALFYLGIAVAFVAYGSVVLEETGKVVEIRKRYDDIDECSADWRYPSVCVIDLEVPRHMSSPIFLYYEIQGMYQNHRRYAKSRDVLQLLGHDQSTSQVQSYCTPVVDMDDLGLATTLNLTGGDVANPCGLIAKSYFNDTYQLFLPGGDGLVEIHEDKIAWDVDKNDKFERSDHAPETQWTDVRQGNPYIEHFMVWMSIAGLPTFRKLWGRIESDLPSGTYRLLINNNYDVSGFSGEKLVVLSTVCAFGGKIAFLGVLYVVVGGIALVGAGVMLATFYCKRRYNLS